MTETIKELAPYLTALAEKLSTTADKVWAMQLLQAKITMVSMLLRYSLNIALIYGTYIGVKKFTKWHSESGNYDNDGLRFIAVACVVAWIAVLVVETLCNISGIETLVTVIVNPEYYAIKELLRMVK
jgi:hypothetical protein